jgi:hypothetical protein
MKYPIGHKFDGWEVFTFTGEIYRCKKLYPWGWVYKNINEDEINV